MPAALTATYRLQLHKDFSLEQARDVVPYLARLGISHAYASPILTARPGSTHGYDVADPTRVNPELGGDEARRGFLAALRGQGMGLLLDIVPNHMGTGPTNPFWEDVLTHGRQSAYARWFDVDWSAPDEDLRGRIMLPVLGAELSEVLKKGELSVATEGGRPPRLKYFENTFPLDPATTKELPAGGLDSKTPEGRAALRKLLDRQHYRLTFWRRAGTDINYRRFFEINELVALRTEDPAVFDATHRVILEWVRAGEVDGLRVDHVDGLLDPLGYLERLREAVGGEIPILVEKILSPGESLRAEWPIQGSTGYEALNDVEALFMDGAGAEAVEARYRGLLRLRGERARFAEVAFNGKLQMLRGTLTADVRRLGRRLREALPAPAGVPARQWRQQTDEAITQLIAALPVYRSYVDGRPGTPTEEDRRVVRRAVERLRERGDATPLVERVARVLLLEEPRVDREAALRFVRRFQQTSGPATAKGVEDTALYLYVPLVSRNEVGGDPERSLDDPAATLHRANAERAERWPQALVTTNTHDTKRSADVRARVDVLTEIPEEWGDAAARWHRAYRALGRTVKGRHAPGTNAEYLLYQTMLGIWPLPSATGEGADPAALRERVEQYMLKAAREGKARTSWTDTDEEYESALKAFIAALLVGESGAHFRREMSALVERVARPGLWNALARAVVHLTSPGTPDVYQGDELWNFALVDPDNRRPVDYALRARLLDELDRRSSGEGAERLAADLMRTPDDGRVKLHVMRAALQLRRARPELFTRGSYEPLDAVGDAARHVFAFARRHGDAAAVTIVPRLPLTLMRGSTDAPVGAAPWGDTVVVRLPTELVSARWRDALTGAEVPSGTLDATPSIRVADALKTLPVAVLVSG